MVLELAASGDLMKVCLGVFAVKIWFQQFLPCQSQTGLDWILFWQLFT